MDLLFETIKRNKNAFMLIGFGVLILFYFAVQIFFRDNGLSNQNPNFNVTVDPTRLELESTIPENTSNLKIYDTFQPVTFVFTTEIVPESFTYSVSPVLETRTQSDPLYPDRITIKPTILGWSDGVEYTIYVSSVISKSGGRLVSPFIVTYRNSPPPTENLLLPY